MLLFEDPRWFAAAGAAAAGILLLSRRRGREHATAYLDLWEKALARASWLDRLVQRLPGAQALLLAAAVFFALSAAARPVRRTPGGRDFLLLLDASGSMRAESNGGTRFDAARRALAAVVASLGPEDRAAFGVVGRIARIDVPWTRDRDALARALAAAQTEELPDDLGAALGALRGLDAVTFLATDLVAEKLPAARAFPGLHILAVGSPAPNAGIVDLRVEDTFPEATVRVTATIEGDGAARAGRSLRVAGGEPSAPIPLREPNAVREIITIEIPRGRGGELRVELAPPDAWPADDGAAFCIERPATSPLVLVDPPAGGEGRAFLRAAGEALRRELGMTVLAAAAPEDAPPDAVLLMDGGSLPRLPARSILFGTAVAGVTAAADPIPDGAVRVRGDRPLASGLSFPFLRATPRLRFASNDGALVDGARCALIVERNEPGARTVAATFRLSESNLPILGGTLPVFLRRALDVLLRDRPAVVPYIRARRDPSAAVRGLPMDGPGALGPCVLPDGRATVASLLERIDLTPHAAPPASPIAEGPPVDHLLTLWCFALSAAAAVAWVALELVTSAAARSAELSGRAAKL